MITLVEIVRIVIHVKLRFSNIKNDVNWEIELVLKLQMSLIYIEKRSFIRIQYNSGY